MVHFHGGASPASTDRFHEFGVADGLFDVSVTARHPSDRSVWIAPSPPGRPLRRAISPYRRSDAHPPEQRRDDRPTKEGNRWGHFTMQGYGRIAAIRHDRLAISDPAKIP
jgi:hypothetical protein